MPLVDTADGVGGAGRHAGRGGHGRRRRRASARCTGRVPVCSPPTRSAWSTAAGIPAPAGTTRASTRSGCCWSADPEGGPDCPGADQRRGPWRRCGADVAEASYERAWVRPRRDRDRGRRGRRRRPAPPSPGGRPAGTRRPRWLRWRPRRADHRPRCCRATVSRLCRWPTGTTPAHRPSCATSTWRWSAGPATGSAGGPGVRDDRPTVLGISRGGELGAARRCTDARAGRLGR